MTPEERAAAINLGGCVCDEYGGPASGLVCAAHEDIRDAIREAEDAEGGALRAEGERLARIVVRQQEALKAMETKLDRQAVEHIKRGDTNARLNKENARLTRQLAAARSEAEARVDAETEACAEIADTEEQVSGPIPLDLALTCLTPEGATAVIRATIHATKVSIARRIRQRAVARGAAEAHGAKPAP